MNVPGKMKLKEISWKAPRRGMGTGIVFQDCRPRIKESHDQSHHECVVPGASERTW